MMMFDEDSCRSRSVFFSSYEREIDGCENHCLEHLLSEKRRQWCCTAHDTYYSFLPVLFMWPAYGEVCCLGGRTIDIKRTVRVRMDNLPFFFVSERRAQF